MDSFLNAFETNSGNDIMTIYSKQLPYFKQRGQLVSTQLAGQGRKEGLNRRLPSEAEHFGNLNTVHHHLHEWTE
eukprot:gene9660-20087_t